MSVQEMQLLLANPFNRNNDVDGFRRRAQIVGNTEITQAQRRCRFEAHAVTAPRVLAMAEHFRVQRYRFGYAVQRQVTGNLAGVLAGQLDLRALERCRRVLADIEEVFATQMLVALGMIAVDACGLDGGANAAVLRILRIQLELAGKIVEATVQPAVAKVGNLEHDKLVLAALVKRVSAAWLTGHHDATDQQRKQTGNKFL